MNTIVSSGRLAELLAFAAGVSQTLSVARGLVEAGRCVELAGLQDKVGLLCAQSLDLPPDEGRAMRAELIVLLARTQALSAALSQAGGKPPVHPRPD